MAEARGHSHVQKGWSLKSSKSKKSLILLIYRVPNLKKKSQAAAATRPRLLPPDPWLGANLSVPYFWLTKPILVLAIGRVVSGGAVVVRQLRPRSIGQLP